VGNIKDLIVKILVDDEEVQKFQKAGDKAQNFGSSVDHSAKASAGALALLGGGLFEAGHAAADAEQSQNALQFALDKFPATADTSAEKLYKLNDALALKTQFDHDAYASGQATLAQYGLTGAQIEQITPLLGDYAAKTGQDIPTAAESLGKALLGQGRALKDIGIKFKDAHSVGGNYAELMTGLSAKVGGFAETQGTTAVGANDIFKNSIGLLFETLGQKLLPVMVEVSHVGIGVMTWMKDNKEVVLALATAIGVIAGGVVLLAAGMKIMAIAQAIQTVAQWANNAAWLASPVTWIILAIIVGIALLVAAAIWLYNNWGAVTKWLGEAFANVAAWFKSVGDGIAKWWNDLWAGIGQWVVDTFGPAIKWAMNEFALFQLGLKIIGDGISKWWNDLWSGIGSFFGTIWNGLQDIVRGAWNGIVGWIESGVNTAIGLINGILGGINGVGGAIGIHLNLIPNVNIPRLATGGITNGPQLAMVGDNPGGREAILPLNSPAARSLLGGNTGPTELSDSTIDKLARALAGYARVQGRQGAVV
jgi:hypothetical protein